MCRWAAWIGAETFLEDVVTGPEQSLIKQSRNALESKTNINADGFGVAWYDAQPEPGLYKNILPAWSDPNLHHLVHQVRARLFLAHVRASTGTATGYDNCHPFTAGVWSFVHNGQVGGFRHVRKSAIRHGNGNPSPRKRQHSVYAAGVLTVSEPLDSSSDDWHLLDSDMFLVATERSVRVRSFLPTSQRKAA